MMTSQILKNLIILTYFAISKADDSMFLNYNLTAILSSTNNNTSKNNRKVCNV